MFEFKNKYEENKKNEENKILQHLKKYWQLYALSTILPVGWFIYVLANKNTDTKVIKEIKIPPEIKETVKNIFDRGFKYKPHSIENMSLENYIKNEEISDNVVSLHNLLNQVRHDYKIDKFNDVYCHISRNLLVSSKRKLDNSVEPTPLEQKLDELVDNDDLPIKQFTLSQIDDLYEINTKNHKNQEKAVFVKETGCDVLKLYESASDGAIVQVASQYNALESVGSYFSPVYEWSRDGTQGPRACLQAVVAAKHRESAYLKNKLPDAVSHILSNCKINGVSINEKYNKVYEHGYLQLYNIKDKNDLKQLKDHIANNNNIGSFGLNGQWVICENNKKQFQIFMAAPSFQGAWQDWSKRDKQTNCFREICRSLVVAQYKASAQIAVIKSISQSKQSELHLTRVGQSAFGNPPEIMTDCLNIVYDIVKDYNVKVIVHEYHKDAWAENIRNSNLPEDLKSSLLK